MMAAVRNESAWETRHELVFRVILPSRIRIEAERFVVRSGQL